MKFTIHFNLSVQLSLRISCVKVELALPKCKRRMVSLIFSAKREVGNHIILTGKRLLEP